MIINKIYINSFLKFYYNFNLFMGYVTYISNREGGSCYFEKDLRVRY